MIEDDADAAALDAWYRRSVEDIEAEKAARKYAAWEALRTPDHLAYEPDVIRGATGDDELIGGDRPKPKYSGRAPTVQQLDAYQRALLDSIGGHEAPGYDVLYSPTGTLRRMKRGADGQVDYRRHPNDPAQITTGPNKGNRSSAAGRYQVIKPTWDGLTRQYSDLKDFTPASQDRGAWYLAYDTYAADTGRDLSKDLRDPARYPAITGSLRKQWTSLPGGSEQGQGQSEFERRMNDGLARHQGRGP